MKIRQAATASGLSVDTIRFYERVGVLPAPPRRENGYREYTPRHVTALRFARGLRDLGLPLPRIKLIVGVAHDATCVDVRVELLAALEDASAAIDGQLQRLAHLQHEVETLASGLRAMKREEDPVPGLTPCRCVEFVANI